MTDLPGIYTAAEVAVALRQSPSAVNRSARRLGVGRKVGNQRLFSDADLAKLHSARRRAYTPAEQADVCRRYQAGETILAIVDALGMPKSSVQFALRQSGVVMRARGRQHYENRRRTSASLRELPA